MNSNLISDLVQRLVDYERRLERLEAKEKLLVPVWEDLPPTPIISARLGASAPTLAVFRGTIYQYTFDNVDDVVYGATEITHMWKEGTRIWPHIHWASNGQEATAKGVRWRIGLALGAPNGAFSAAVARFVDTEIPANTPSHTHFISEWSAVTSATTIGSYLVWALTRAATEHANGEPAANPFGLAVGFHAEMNSLGSRKKFVK